MSRIIARSLTNETFINMSSTAETATNALSFTSPGLVISLTVVPIVIVSVVIIAVLMRKGSCSNIASKVGNCRSSSAEKLQPWPSQSIHTVEASFTSRPEPTFVQRHLTTLRAWQKPTMPAYPPLPSYLGRPTATRQPCRTTVISFDEWEKGYRNVRPKGPVYWKQYGEAMEARKSWWEKIQDRLRKRFSNAC